MSDAQGNKRRIRSIEKVRYSLLKRFPPILVIEVDGWVDGMGWTSPELRLLSSVDRFERRFLELEFVATPPSETSVKEAQPLRAQLAWQDNVDKIEGIKVYSATEEKTTVSARS